MKSGILKAMVVGAALAMAVPALATDYSQYSLQELAQMRGTLANKTPEERQAFRDAWRAKMQSATPEERAAFAQGRGRGQRGGFYGNNANSANATTMGQRGRGSCNGTGPGPNAGQGRGRGRGGRW